ncbi:MAG: hypothetical protein HZC51_04790 [Nitrospirae bacterium]|nr:hypothetical protein [Nitrospirota bacterium]
MPKPEKAIYTTSLAGLRKAGPGYTRAYFGAEFCQWRLPGRAGLAGAIALAEGRGMSFTLVTPWVTDEGIRRLKALFRVLTGAGMKEAEVVVNDYGVLTLLREEFPGLAPVLGRLLVKRKCCPRIPGMLEGMPDAGRDIYLHAGMEDPVAAGLIKGFGVKRVDMDVPLQGLAPDLKSAGLRGSVYTPYAYVTTTRHCPASFDGTGWQAFEGCRLKGCLKNVLSLTNPAHEARLLMRGNTQFVENRELPEGLAAMGIDRIVYMEDVP